MVYWVPIDMCKKNLDGFYVNQVAIAYPLE